MSLSHSVKELEQNLEAVLTRLRNAERERGEATNELRRVQAAREMQRMEADEARRMLKQQLAEAEARLAGVLGQEAMAPESWVSRPPLPCPPQLVATVQAFIAEYHRAKAKHGEMTMDGTMTGNEGRNDLLRLGSLMEEAGEVAELFTYDKDAYAVAGEGSTVEGGWVAALMKELVQVMNVAGTWHSYLVAAASSPVAAPDSAQTAQNGAGGVAGPDEAQDGAEAPQVVSYAPVLATEVIDVGASGSLTRPSLSVTWRRVQDNPQA